ncbi:tRNA pseudouridine(54/55) synthase Pus10 [Thermococcus chitonophagus]|uniref:tRNA pseudouridine synthase Pus10 n=1 Tax=Thermococcus chitonophagus TaxID=54262 RepID=A0A170SIR8_9EURY|nr:tRNA pseudouridine(54/55) synthase Pus10 [Thermococcus chitonophagus]ASJ17043.1 tRNA pseudouridine(54/55) synthase Pus10 [Thermococcus chitonophagus]CUX77634.1 tRNA pseudouridine 55 synthase Archaea [Thermococcus chitonophagus]
MILEKAKEVLEEYGLCNHCLGRLFAKLGTGSNEERGKAIRLVLEMETGLNFEEPDECDLCGGVFRKIPEFVDLCIEAVKDYEFETFRIGSRFPQEIIEKEREIWTKFKIETGEPINREFNRELGKAFAVKTGKKPSTNPDLVIVVEPFSKKVELQVNPIYVAGRYRKLVRGIPQTPAPGFKESVATIICRAFRKHFNGKCVFKGAGREDVDVRMLGRGRPFVVEIKRPKKRKIDLEDVEREINSSRKVEVLDLRLITPREAEEILTRRHRKLYEALVYVKDGVSREEVEKVVRELTGAEIRQRTPRRVLNSRADLVRVRKVYKAEGELIDDKHFKLRLLTDGGLYIKELISGDKGRTTPSVSEILGKEAWCELLDVLEVLEDDADVEGDS